MSTVNTSTDSDALPGNSITSLAMPRGATYAALHDRLKQDGFVVYEGQGRLAAEIFRVANMGALSTDDFDRFLGSLRRALGGDAA